MRRQRVAAQVAAPLAARLAALVAALAAVQLAAPSWTIAPHVAASAQPRPGRAPAAATRERAHTLSAADDAFLEDLSRRSFQFFWEQADPATGIVRDRSRTDGSSSSDSHAVVGSIASVGFGLTGLCMAAERGWMPRDQVVARARTTLRTFAERLTHEHGWFYHWLNVHTGAREWNSEVSSIDTALLLGGVLSVRQCFNADAEIARLGDTIYRRLDFTWIRNGHPTLASHGWRPESGMIVHRWDSYSEAMLLYLLGLGSPTSPLPPASWRAWTRPELEWQGLRYVTSVPPLFIHQYSHAWIDFQSWRDPEPPYDWFENAVVATRANRQYCLGLSARFPGYTPTIWGISASDGRQGYRAWGGPPPDPQVDGTVVPSAAAGSLMLAPELTLPALVDMKRRYGDRLYGRYGFADAFDPTAGWFNPDVIGIDVGITLLSAENLRSGNVWRWFMANPEMQTAMRRAGFTRVEPAPARAPETAAEMAPEVAPEVAPEMPPVQATTGTPPVRGTSEYRLVLQPEPPALERAHAESRALSPGLVDRFESASFDAPNGVTLPYRLLRPHALRSPSLRAGARYPLVVVFHGSDEIGTDNARHMTPFALAWARDRTREAFPAFVLAPQMPARSAHYSGGAAGDQRTSEPGPPLHAALALIDALAAKYPIDRARLYVIGFSMGASTTWNAVNLEPHTFAAAIPISGVPNVAQVKAVAGTPLWIVHGNRDDTNPIRHDRIVYQPLVDAGARVRFWEIDLLGHEVPPWLLVNDDFARWLFAQRRAR